MIKFEKNEFSELMICSTNDKYGTRSRVSKEMVEDIKNLQEENKELKKTIDIVASLEVHSETEAIGKEKLISCVEELHREHEILTKFEEWLEDKLKDNYANNDVARGYKYALKICFYKLQILKGYTKLN